MVSVIVPNYNHASYLKKRIESILNQTYNNFEIILLDDCSSDNSVKILSDFVQYVQVSHFIVNKENSGSPFLQWKKGIELAKGDYVWIAESDDWCEPSFLETLIPILQDNKEIMLGFVQSYYIVGENDIKWISIKNELQNIKTGIEFISENLLTGNAIYNASMAVFRKSAYDNIFTDFTKYKFCGDWIFWAEIAKQGKVFTSGKILNYFRNHNGDVSSKAYGSGLNFIEELKVLFSFLDQNLITNSQFFTGLSVKFYNYKTVQKNLSNEVMETLNYMFLSDVHTVKFRMRLWRYYLKMLSKQKIKIGLNKVISRL